MLVWGQSVAALSMQERDNAKSLHPPHCTEARHNSNSYALLSTNTWLVFPGAQVTPIAVGHGLLPPPHQPVELASCRREHMEYFGAMDVLPSYYP